MVRTRFAPSPTGYLHIGSVRTALYCWLYAKHTGGQCLLRIEDTDRERSTQDAVDAILEGLQWLNLDFDGEIEYQTKRFDRYQQIIDQLLQQEKAYYCECSKERLEQLRESQIAQKQKPRYDGHCRDKGLKKTDNCVVRFKNPLDGEVIIPDQIRGVVTVKNSELDDLIIVRSDGTPTYNLTVVVDDWDMKITHVIRGDDHLNNTPRQMNILQALGAKIPVYAHMPMILGDDGKRLSKRHGAVSVQYYRDEGILPDALLNYLVRLGWSHGDQEIFTRDEMIKHFDINDIQKSAAKFDNEKLLWLNQRYIKDTDPDQLVSVLQEQLRSLGVNTFDTPELSSVVEAQNARSKTMKEMAKNSVYFYQEPEITDPKAKELLTPEACSRLKELQSRLASLENWTAQELDSVIRQTASDQQVKLPDIAKPLRVVLTGGTVSPPIDRTLALIGKARVIERLQRLLA